MKSMTGYGKGVVSKDGLVVTTEIRGLNHKGLDIQVKLPHFLISLEGIIREILKKSVKRGRVEIYISYQVVSPKLFEVRINKEVIENISKQIYPLIQDGIIKEGITFSDLKELQGFFSIDFKEDALVIFKNNLTKSLRLALKEFDNQRKVEGKELRKQFLETVIKSERITKEIKKYEKSQKVKVVEKFKSNLKEVLEDFDEKRVEEESVIYSQKCDIKEEVVRIDSHLKSVINLLKNVNGEKGRKLDFLFQEIQREISTLLAKSFLIEITNLGLELRYLIEQLREQVQNVE